MKKIILSAAVMISATVFGQRAQKGDLQLNAGLALPHRYAENVGLYAGLDYGVHNDVTVGVEGRFGGKDYDGNNRGSWIGLGVNGNYHFNTLMGIPNKYDFYAGLTVGFNSFNFDHPNNPDYRDPHKSEPGVSAQVGGRYYFNNNFGLNAEANAGGVFNGGKIGISYKF
ncbi:MAG: hypothetical protein K0M56_01520 [Kaistella sp.]|nr:hypothetical protein [Kaistella sp.]